MKATREQRIKLHLEHIRFGAVYQNYYAEMRIRYKPHVLLPVLTYPVATRISDQHRCLCVEW